MHRNMPDVVVIVFALSIVIGCSRSESDAVTAPPVTAIVQQHDGIARFLDPKLSAAERLATADQLETDKEGINFILRHIPKFLSIAQSGDEPQSIRFRALQLLTACACVHPFEGCESAILAVVNDETESRVVRAAGAILLIQLPASNWDIDVIMDIIIHKSVPEKLQEEAIESSTPIFLVAPNRSLGLCRRLLKCATTNDIRPSLRRAALSVLEFHGIPWITDSDEWTSLRRVGEVAITLLRDNEQNGQVRQAAVGVASAVQLCISDKTATGWDDYSKDYAKALSRILTNDAESEEMRTAAAAACRFLGKSVAKELVLTFETGLFIGGAATQRYVMDAIAACDESRDLWLPIIDRYIEDDTRDPDVRRRATAVRRSVGPSCN